MLAEPSEGPRNGLNLRMDVSHGDLDVGVARDAGEGKGIAPRFPKPRQGGVPQAVRFKGAGRRRLILFFGDFFDLPQRSAVLIFGAVIVEVSVRR